MPCWIRPLHSKVEFIIQRRVVLAFKKFALCMFLYRINKYFISINKSNMFNSFTHSIPLGLQINTVSWKIKPRVTLCFSVYPYQFQLVSCALVSFLYHMSLSKFQILPSDLRSSNETKVKWKINSRIPIFCQHTIDFGTGSKLNYFKWAVIRLAYISLNPPLRCPLFK